MSQIEGGIAPGQVLLLATDDHSYAFDLWEHFRISLGRHQSNDVPLVSRKVSNYHAEILNEGDGWLLRDLGSTNGSYVNEEPVRERRLSQGDRIRIGGYELTVHLKARNGNLSPGKAPPVGARGQLAPVAAQPAGIKGARDKGRVTSLADLLRVFFNKAGTGLLEIRNQRSVKGKIFVDAGQVVHAELGEARGEKALHRLFRWSEASFEVLEYPEPTRVPKSIELPTETLVAEAVIQAEEWDKISRVLPPFIMALRLKEDCPLPLCELSPTEIEIFQSIIRHETIQKVLEDSLMPDFLILTTVHRLLCKKVIMVSESSGPMMEETFILRSDKTGVTP